MPRPPERLPSPPASLDRERAERLTALTERALLQRRLELAQAIELALEHIPAPLRGPVRRALGA